MMEIRQFCTQCKRIYPDYGNTLCPTCGRATLVEVTHSHFAYSHTEEESMPGAIRWPEYHDRKQQLEERLGTLLSLQQFVFLEGLEERHCITLYGTQEGIPTPVVPDRPSSEQACIDVNRLCFARWLVATGRLTEEM